MFTTLIYRARMIAGAVSGRRDMSTEDRNYRNLLLSGLWFGPVDGGIYNFLGVFLARLGASASVVGLLTSGPALLSMLTYIPGGALAERYTDQMKLFVRITLLARLSYLLIALLPLLLTGSALPLAIVLVWALAAIPNSIGQPAWTAAMAQAVPPRRRAALNGARWSLMSLVSGALLLVFGLWLDRGPFPLAYQIVFLISFVAGVLNLYYFWRVSVPPFVPAARAAEPLHIGARLADFFRPLGESRPFVRYNIASIGFRLALALPAGLYSIYWVNDLRATDSWIGLRGTAGYAALVVGYWFWGRAANRIGHRRLLLICGATFALYPTLTALAPSVHWLLPAAVLWGLAASGIDLGLFDMLLAVCPEGQQPRFAAAANTLASLALTLGPLLGAGLAAAVTVRGALFVSGALQFASTFAFLLLPEHEHE
ncbi:MAG: Major Facilitator Superfamily protein [Chloroflexi bacterium ADurb.Bin325]|nr:MAG: Major Facilitator Superfamily protein [Chloroflexi bacterium ADurb.Bin325]